MVLHIDAAQQSCRMVARQMRSYARPLHLSFIVHRSNQYLESLSLAGKELLSRPSGKTALRLIRNQKGVSEQSAFLGLASWRENLFLGLAHRQNMMALATLNIDDFESMREIRAQAWHLAWHAIHLYNQRNAPGGDDILQNGVIFPNYDAEALPSVNLRADVFSAIMCHLSGDKDAIRRLAHARCMDSLVRRAGFSPENYPFPLALEATQVALSDALRKPPSQSRQIHTAMKLAENIARTYDTQTLKQWVDFCKPAQSMAWRGEPKEIILGAAVGISRDTFVRSTGFLVCEITQTAPSSIVNLEDRYIPFSDDRHNQNLHETIVDKVFEKAASSGLQRHNAIPFLDAANEQNQKLSDGHILGWCASALQAAGNAFDAAMKSGSKTPVEDARRQFESIRHETSWDHLKQLGEAILERYRQGYAVTFSDIIDFCGNTPALAGVASSISLTTRDPSYLKKLNISNDIRPGITSEFKPTAAPKDPALSGIIRRRAPEFRMGGGGFSSLPQRAPPPDEDYQDQ
jgi:hypothetical protein